MFYKFEMTNHKHILFQRELVPLDDFLRILPNVSLGNSVGKSVNVLKTEPELVTDSTYFTAFFFTASF